MLNQTMLYETKVLEGKQRIVRIETHNLRNIPITPPPFRDKPNVEHALLLEVETNDGVIGWATSGYTHHVVVDLIAKYLAPRIIEEKTDPFRTERIPQLFDRHTYERPLGRALIS